MYTKNGDFDCVQARKAAAESWTQNQSVCWHYIIYTSPHIQFLCSIFYSGQNVILNNCVDEGFTEEEFDRIADKSDPAQLNLERLAVHLLGDGGHARHNQIKRELNSQGDHDPRTLCRRILMAWNDATDIPGGEMRKQLVRVMCDMNCFDMAHAVASKEYWWIKWAGPQLQTCPKLSYPHCGISCFAYAFLYIVVQCAGFFTNWSNF